MCGKINYILLRKGEDPHMK